MTIAAILKTRQTQIFTLTLDHSVADAVDIFATRRIGAAPVMDGDTVAGIFSERDVIRCLHDEGASALQRRVAEVMTAPALVVAASEQVIGALSLMTHRRIRHLPVAEDGHLIGFVSIGDLVKYRIDRIEADAEAMRSYIQQA